MTFDGVTVKYAGGRFLMNHRVYTLRVFLLLNMTSRFCNMYVISSSLIATAFTKLF